MSLDTVLLVAGVVLIGLEIVVPGGILGAIGLLSLTAGFFFLPWRRLGCVLHCWRHCCRACGNLRAAVLVYTVIVKLESFCAARKAEKQRRLYRRGRLFRLFRQKGKVIAPLRLREPL